MIDPSHHDPARPAPRAVSGSSARWSSVRQLVVAGFALALVVANLPAPLAAQEPDSSAVIPLDEIEVTVLRTPILLGEVPFAVSVLGTSALTRGKAGLSIEEALQGLPGVQVQNRYNSAVGERISIRGFGARSQFGVRGVTVLVDGIPATLPDGQSTLDHLDLGTLGRVEALRGPGSSAYGNGAGGVLRFETRRAADQPFRPEFSFVDGSNGMRRLQATTSGVSGETEYLLSASRFKYEGFRRNPVADDGSVYGEARKLHLNGQLRSPVANGELVVTANLANLDGDNPGSINDSLLAVGDRRAHRGNIFQGTNKQVTQGQLGVRWTGAAAAGEADLSAWGLFRNLDNPIPPAVIDLKRNAAGVRGALRGHAGASEQFSWNFGGEYALQRDDRQNHGNDGGERSDLRLDQLENVRTAAFFGQGDLRVGERARLVGGVRYDRLDFSVEDAFLSNGDDSGDRLMDAISPSLGLHVAATPSMGLFVNIGTSFESPTTTELANDPSGRGGFNPELNPQRSLSLEVGTRGVSDNTFAYELSVFRTSITDALVPIEVPDIDRTFYANAGSASHRGFEAAVTLAPGGGASLRATYSYTDAVFDDYVARGNDYGGNQIPGLAPHRAEAIASVRVAEGFLKGNWELRAAHVSAIPVNDRNTAEADAYQLLDARYESELEEAFGVLDTALYMGVTNIFDTLYTASVVVNAFGGRFHEPGPGRSFYFGTRWGVP
ncbi:MAG: TonB-dependent receptor [Gammaproteobacteria bacterium]|nr:TonB-dependent receptor [Gammaproteobacteria bacterium]MYC51450.1 TonB-dependent receptor [Gammaproteobacteria bacterium]